MTTAIIIFIAYSVYSIVDITLDMITSKTDEMRRRVFKRHFLKTVPDREITLAGQIIAQQFIGENYVIVINPN